MRSGLWLWLFVAGAWAQAPPIVATRVYVDEPCAKARPTFYVDGVAHNGAVTLFWPEGSKHILSITSQETAPGARCNFTGWLAVERNGKEVPLQDGLNVTVTAHRDIAGFKAQGSLQYRLQLQIVSEASPGARFACLPGPLYGKVYINGVCLASNAEMWIAEGTEVQLQAYPPEGFVFLGWQLGAGTPQAAISQFAMRGPVILAAMFAPAVRVRLLTDPPGLELLADRTRVRTPVTLDWAENSAHTLAPVTPQMDEWGRWWVFESWSNGQPAQHTYIPKQNNVPELITARFVPGVQVTLQTRPPGLKLEVDGRDNWPSLNFIWGAGSTHRISAPPEQVWQGRRYAFSSWSNQGPASQQITVPAEAWASGLRLTAEYELLGRLRIDSTHEVSVEVNGAPCRTPCLIEPRQGTTLSLRAPVLVTVDEWRRLEFQGWADYALPERLWTAGAAEEVLNLNYQASHRVLALVDPPEAATVTFEPASPDGFYGHGSTLRLTVKERPGFRFERWDGDLSGTSRELIVAVTEPRIVRAVFSKVPYVPPSGVRNAAGVRPDPAVAPGSLIAIYGSNLAPAYIAGPDNPLAQSLGGVTVVLGDRLLPLKFVSPEQINAQLFSDLAEGDYRLRITQPEREPIEATLVVARNAPGLFTREESGREVVLAVGEDGNLIGYSRPARRGEIITVLGTGFGPYKLRLPDGFAVPEGLNAELEDEVEIPAGEQVLRPLWAGAAAGHVGVTAIKFQITPEVPGGEFGLKMRVRGRESNTVILPVQ